MQYNNVGLGQLTISGNIIGCIIKDCIFSNCRTIQQQGGAVNLYIGGGTYADIINSSFIKCQSEQNFGGAIYANLNYLGASLSIQETCIFSECTAGKSGGALFVTIVGANSHLFIDKGITFDKCKSLGIQYEGGGAIYIDGYTSSNIEVSNTVITECESKVYGGGLDYQSLIGSSLIIRDTQITSCSALKQGGGIIAVINDQGAEVDIIDVTIRNCSSLIGGGLHFETQKQSLIEMNKLIFSECQSKDDGGGIFISVICNSQNSIILKGLSFANCQSLDTNGGGMYILTDGYDKVISIEDLTVINCSSKSFGGGIYIFNQQNVQMSINGNSILKNCTSEQGGGLHLFNGNPFSIFEIGGIFEMDNCTANQNGGGIYMTLIANRVLFENMTVTNCTALDGSGGFMFAEITISDEMTMNNCDIHKCSCTYGNGGGIFLIIGYETNQHFKFNEVLIHECKSTKNEQGYPSISGFGGGIFLSSNNNWDYLNEKIDFHGLKMYGNTAGSGGQNMFASFAEVQQWCLMGIDGEYVKGNYSDGISAKNELQGIPKLYIELTTSTTELIIADQEYLEDYWTFSGSIFHVSNRNNASPTGNDQDGCALIINPCRTIEYALQQISIQRELLQTSPTSEKRIGICSYGFDLIDPFLFNPSSSLTNVVKIMKQLYGTSSAMIGQAEIKILKNNDDSKENGKVGWISASGGLQLHLYGLNIIMDNSQLQIPIIYIQDSNSLLELHTITFSGIKLSPTSEAKGIIHIKYETSQLIAQSCIFSNINISSKGGNAIRILNSGSYPITSSIKGCQFNNISSIGDSNGRGGSAIYMESKHGSKLIIEDSSQFYKCVIDKGNGGAIYIDIDFASEFEFQIADALIQECQTKSDTSKDLPPTGYGGGIFLTGSGDYDPSTKRLDLKGMKIFGNMADNGGQSLYVAMTKLKEWCIIGNAGEYVKGNYSDGISNMNELQGITIDQQSFNILQKEQIQIQQRALEYYWNVRNSLYHIHNRNGGQYYGQDQQWCGNWDEPCESIQYAIDLISIKQGSSITKVEEKNIGISQYGYDLVSPIQLSKSGSHTDVVKIMKQMYGTPSQMSGNAEMKIMKNNDDNKENGKVGWISASGGLQLHLYGLSIIMDNSQLQIPIIYIQDSNSLLELNSNTFSGIKLSPTSEAKGIIHIKYDNSQLIAQSCIFSNINISSKGGNAIRILNSGSQPITSSIKECQFNNISSVGDSNGRGGSAIYMESKHGSKLIIEDSSQFYKCIIDKGNGGAIYIDIDFASEFEFKINDALIIECQTKSDTSKELPPTGYGGGIFLAGNGDYDPSKLRLDLKGMKILGNIADYGGQSLYVAMSNVIE
ncbi:MAG: hypothetical protein EZS28_018683 [Streblomastix strix]|uniref:Right handed beta helix domain-containing protein n=1 Tax=Streblomastix strix TaxID=222440 RepID=A0A5J4VT66_9EUKA|nr:MAG: hypothetical protein EZS28_018683 [Streblomastix strix]